MVRLQGRMEGRWEKCQEKVERSIRAWPEPHRHPPQELSNELADGVLDKEFGTTGAEKQCPRLGKWRPLGVGSQGPLG